MEKDFYVYIMASKKNGTLYVGVTSDLVSRVWQHKENQVDSFTKKHDVHHLVHFEQFSDAMSAIAREKRLKAWKRGWKLDLIEKDNPFWHDLYQEII
ncbi:MAG: GIY-YIG nuclease family protein [Marinicella sp.]